MGLTFSSEANNVTPATDATTELALPSLPSPSATSNPARTSVEDVDAPLGVQALVYLQPTADGVFVEQAMEFANLGNSPLPSFSGRFPLPHGFRNLRITESSEDVSIRDVIQGSAIVEGQVPPGTVSLGLQYELPRASGDTFSATFSVLPNTGGIQVIAALADHLTLVVPGFSPPTPSRNEFGQRILVAQYTRTTKQSSKTSFDVRISGLSPHRFRNLFGVSSMVMLMVGGIVAALWMRRGRAG